MVAFGLNPARGVDCTSLPGVLDVSCISGTCLIDLCQPGYTLLPRSRSRCVPTAGRVIENIISHILPL